MRTYAPEYVAEAARVTRLEESASAGWECIEMAQERIDALIFCGAHVERGRAAMFLPEAISNACILIRDEALAHAEDALRGSGAASVDIALAFPEPKRMRRDAPPFTF